ncbi:LysR family transcriptional regulator [Mucilaginibacter sp.]|jgi:DNA-binding transcriptional LysR family regulator|uniref:LysR family transcriptional regulator n=1 Tax=Mucilaginibacter sp. TaxID=1882438 RepID=UPI002CC249E0|nr:LysR substrate-binding domain-containing protein [Mucilaginibacter sp.]HTI60436.1 LysR substrate-binding domain-containing protein [Mucilaginibacter sp.]
MDVQQINNFLVLCKTLNYRKAAEQINIVQPALSRQIQLLENEMGALLFNRSKRTVTLTEAGLFFQKEADRILQDLNKTIARTAQINNGEAGEVRITHASSAMNTVVPSFLVKVKRKWPNLKTIAQETSNFEQIEMVLARKADIGVAPNVMLPPEMRSKVLYKENYVLILPGDHPLAKKKITDLSVLRDETFILPQVSTGVGYVEAILQLCQGFGFKPNVAHESAHAMGVMRLVEAGLGVSIEPLSSVSGADMNIKLIELKNLPQKASMVLFWLRERDAELSRFIEMF